MADNSNVYSTARPLEGNVRDWVMNQEQMDYGQREEQRRIAAIEEARREKERLKADNLREKLFSNLPKNYDTGSGSLNKFQAGIIQQGVNRLGEIYKELRNPGISDDERIDLEIEAQNIQNLPENLKTATDNFTGIIQDYQKGVADGTYFPNLDFEKKVLSGFDSYVGALDNGLPVVGFVDLDGDGEMDVMPYDNLQKGVGVWNFQKQVDLDKLAVATGEKLGSEEMQTDRNFTKRTVKGPNLNALNSITDSILQNPDGSPSEAALSELKKRGLAATPENLNEIKSIFKNRVLAYTDRSDKTDVDYSGMTAAQREARLQRDANKGDDDKSYSLNDLNLTANTVQQSGDKRETLTNIYQGNVNIQRKAGNATENFRSFAVDKNGNVIVTVDVSMSDNNEDNRIETKKYSSEKNADIVSYFAQRFKDPDTGQFIERIPQLRDKLKSLGAKSLGESEKKKIAGF